MVRSSSKAKRLVALGVMLSSGLFAQVTQFNVQHSIPPNTLKSATGNNVMILPGALGYDYFNGSAVERRILMPWGTNHDYMPSNSNWAVSSDGGRTFGATGGSQTLTSASGYVNRSITSRTGTFSVEFYVTPTVTTSTMTVSLCQGAQSADTGLACSVRFNSSGVIDARNGAAWSAATSVPYTANDGYYVRFDVNLTAHTYTIYVRPPSAAPSDPNTLLGSNYAFRTEQAGVTALDTFNYHVTGSGSLTVSTTAMGIRGLVRQRTTGALLAYNFGWVGPQPTNHSFNFAYYKSTDGGGTWTDQNAVVDFGAIACSSMHFHRDILEENDGSLYAIGYAHFPDYDLPDPSQPGFWRVVMIRSTDGGATWSYRSTIASSSIRNYTESTFARCLDGTWLVVMKATGADNFLRYMRTANQGVSWTGGAAVLPGLTSAFGVDPALSLLPNGTLALSWGPDNAAGASRDLHVAISADGCGTNWSMERTVFTSTLWAPGQHNFPEAGYDDVYEASGYSSIPYTGAHRLLHLSDTGHSWSYNNTIPNPNPYSVRARTIDVVRTNEINRIDLRTKVALDPGMIDTDMTYTDANNQESRPASAVDGSTTYWSGAFKNAASGYYTIDLRQNYTLNKVGVCLHYNTSEGATIERSTDNINWTAIKTYTPDGVNFDAAHGTHRALDYTAFGPVAVRYVRVSVNNSATALVCLNELELYTATDTFENNALGDPGVPHGIIPPGYVADGTSGTQYGFAVRDVGTSAAGYQSERAFQMWDGSSTWRAGIKKTVTPAAASKTLEFRLKPLAYAPTSGAVQFTIGSGTTTVFQIAVFPDGSLNRYDGSAWHQMAGAGTVALNTWSLVQIAANATTGSATVSINGVSKGSAAKITGAVASTLNYFGFGSGGTTPSGDNALFDDISF